MKQVSLEYGTFCSGGGYFSNLHVIEGMMYEDPLSWWENYDVSATFCLLNRLPPLVVKEIGYLLFDSQHQENS